MSLVGGRHSISSVFMRIAGELVQSKHEASAVGAVPGPVAASAPTLNINLVLSLCVICTSMQGVLVVVLCNSMKRRRS